MLVGPKSTMFDFLWWDSIVILVHVQFDPKSGPNIIQYVRKLLFMLTQLHYIAISVNFLTFSTIQLDI